MTRPTVSSVEDRVTYGPENPHPLSQVSTELVWEGKYDEYGNRRQVDTIGLALPLQKIETIDEPRTRIEAQGGLFDSAAAHLDDFRNMLIWGDNKLVMSSLLKNFRGQIDLIYIDPPFDVGADFSMDVPMGDEKETATKDQSAIEMVAYRDMWGEGTDSYLHTMFERFTLMRELLSERGTLYVHCDWHIGHYLKVLLDETFGRDRFLNEIVWNYKAGAVGKASFGRKHDVILRYEKSEGGAKFNPDAVRIPYADSTLQRLKYAGAREKNVQKVLERGGKVPTDVWEIGIVQGNSEEALGFPTQKPEPLLERIIAASTDEEDLVADFFCGSGTTGAVAERMGRRWIMADLGRFAIHTTRKRLIERQRELHANGGSYRALDVLNLGRYERQWWQQERLRGADDEHRRVVLEFFQAERLETSPSRLIHGRKSQMLCHVAGIDSIFTRNGARDVATAATEMGAAEVACLAWEFEMDLPVICQALETEFSIRIRLLQIPREIMERHRSEPPPFLEVATLEVEPVFRVESGQRKVDVEVRRFLPSLAEVPTRELQTLRDRAISSGFDFIDFWAVDFDYKPNEPFVHHWQDFRTLRKRTLRTTSDQRFSYSTPGGHRICVKVIDIFGCDTSTIVEVDS